MPDPTHDDRLETRAVEDDLRALRRRSGMLGLFTPVLFALFAIVATVVAVSSAQHRTTMPARGDTLPGRATPIHTLERHRVFGTPLMGPFPSTSRTAMFAMGCFWGAERRFWRLPGVISTAAGYAGGTTPNPTYEEMGTGMTGHTETVRVVYDPSRIRYEELLAQFWEGHDPTQGMRQGGDIGTQYRSAIFASSAAELRTAERSRDIYQRAITAAGFGAITTEIAQLTTFYFAEDYHQQYLEANPGGYCGHGGTGVSCPIGLAEYEGGAER
jgi:peptide-methionine (S)-S-oxide reductase